MFYRISLCFVVTMSAIEGRRIFWCVRSNARRGLCSPGTYLSQGEGQLSVSKDRRSCA